MGRRVGWIGVALTAPIALLLICCGLFGGALIPWLLDSDAARVQQLTPISAVRFEDSAPGNPALIEGVVSRRNNLSGEGFVAYNRFVAERGADGSLSWELVEEVHPALLVDLADGTVQVVGDYALYDPAANETQGEERFVGLRVGDPLIAVGTLQQGAEGMELQADFVAGLSRSDFLESQRQASLFFRLSGSMFGGCGVILLIVVLVAITLLLRKPLAKGIV